MADELRVFLDHLIMRESLRYERPGELVSQIPNPQENLRLRDLAFPSRVKSLRKPDFQRETWAWTPEDCVSLLESLVNDQVIPSIIMWSSPESGYDYILDGGHRVSVILAWLNDDWGDQLPQDRFRDEEQANQVKKAATEIRDLVRLKVGAILEYRAAAKAIDDLMLESKSPKQELPAQRFKQGFFYQRLEKGYVQLHVQWVVGNYEQAEQSFLKINKSGKQLSDWEIRLVDNRNSSFARLVMSVASIQSVRNYWPKQYGTQSQAYNAQSVPTDEELQEKTTAIISGIEQIYDILFKPAYPQQVQSLQMPLLVAQGPQQRPYYLAELLTVIQGKRGQAAETDKLLSMGRYATPAEIIVTGNQYVQDTMGILNQLIGPSSNPKSLAVVPALYFYTAAARHVRSLLYGFIYWLFDGQESDVLQRKRVFSAYRSQFENVLLEEKDEIVTGLSRKTGSGPEVTAQTAGYFEGLLRLITEHKGAFDSDFQNGYDQLAADILQKKPRPAATKALKSRLFTSRQKSAVVLKALLYNPIRCGICGGALDSTQGVQFDHIVRHEHGGLTEIENARLSHPFCNNNAEQIMAIQSGAMIVDLPLPVARDVEPKLQLSFFNDLNFNY